MERSAAERPRVPDPRVGGPHRGRPQRRHRDRQHDRLLHGAGGGGRQLAGLARGAPSVPEREGVPRVPPGHRQGVPRQREALLRRRGVHPGVRAVPGRAAEPAGPDLLPAARAGDRLHGPLPGRADHHGDLHPGVRGAGARAAGRADLAVLLGGRVAGAGVLGLRRRGVPGRHRVRAPQSDRGGAVPGALALAVDAVRRAPAGGPARGPAPAERLHRPAEGHGAGRVDRRHRGIPAGPDRQRRDVQLHALSGGGRAVRPDHDPAGPVHRLADRTAATAARGGRRAG